MQTPFSNEEMERFSPGAIHIVKRKYTEEGFLEPEEIRATFPAIIYPFRICSESIPNGFSKYDIRGTDWFELDDVDALLEMCEKYRDALKNHITDEEYDECVAVLKEGEEGEDCDEFCTLHSALNWALDDLRMPTIEGFEQTMKENVVVNHFETVLMKEDIQKLRKRYGYKPDDEIDVDVSFVDEKECPIWEDFILACNS